MSQNRTTWGYADSGIARIPKAGDGAIGATMKHQVRASHLVLKFEE